MKSVLNERLKQKMEAAGLSVHALEKRAGLKRSAIQNILHGRSKKPSAEILYAISKVFGCSIREFMDKNNPPIQFSPHGTVIASPSKADRTLNIKYYAKAVKAAEAIFKKNGRNCNEGIALQYIHELYQYTLNSTQHEIDEYFAEWLFKKLFPNEKS